MESAMKEVGAEIGSKVQEFSNEKMVNRSKECLEQTTL
jgi:hypothetical protein